MPAEAQAADATPVEHEQESKAESAAETDAAERETTQEERAR
jgi:hypothetical protein